MNLFSFFNKKNYSTVLIISTLLISSLCQTVYAEYSLYDRGRAFYYGDGVEQDYGKALLAFEQGAKVQKILDMCIKSNDKNQWVDIN